MTTAGAGTTAGRRGKLVVLGGGGFRVPLLVDALRAGPPAAAPVTEVVLHDVDAARLAVIASVLGGTVLGATVVGGHDGPFTVRTTTDLDDALDGARFVFSAIRVGGARGRTVDERVALELGVLGQETVGAGGIAFGLRTVPVATAIAHRIAARAPDARVVSFTNPAGMITEAMQRVLGDRVVGVCDSPVGLIARAARALDLPPGSDPGVDPGVDYVGLNHLGWLRGLRVGGVDRLPELLADDERLARIEEARLIGPEQVRALGALPNEYLYYVHRTREAVASARAATHTRGEFLHAQQERFYAAAAVDPAGARVLWNAVRGERDAGYMAEGRAATGAGERAAVDVATGGYQQVALDLMDALSGGPTRVMILNVRNGTAVAGLPPEAVVEVPCAVGPFGVAPLAVAPLPLSMLDLLAQVKAVEQDTIDAALTGSPTLARRALAGHPLVDSDDIAARLLAAYRARSPEIDAVFTAPAAERA